MIGKSATAALQMMACPATAAGAEAAAKCVEDLTLRIFIGKSMIVATFAGLLLAAAQARTWSSADGTRTFVGELVSYDAQRGMVTVAHAGGGRMSFPEDKLSEADIAFLKEQAAKTSVAPASGRIAPRGSDDKLSGFAGEASATRGEPSLVHRWAPPSSGSVRIVGSYQKHTPDADAELHVLAGSGKIWSAAIGKADGIRHGFDIPALDLTAQTPLSFMLSTDSSRVDLKIDFEFIPEPFASRWRADLPDGYPEWSDRERTALRAKGQEILDKIRAAKGRITIPPGDYIFHADWSSQSTLKDLASLEIDANGATFWFEPPMVHGLLFENCRDVTLRGLEIDFTHPVFSLARITGIDRVNQAIRADLMEGYQPLDQDGKPESSGERKLIFYDSDGKFINHRHIRGDWTLSDDGKSILYSKVRVNPLPEDLKTGDHVVSPIQTGAALRSVNCARMRFEDINIWSSPGMAVYEGGGEGGNIYRRVRATRRPHTNRLHAFGADAFHLSATDRGPLLDRCESAYAADDNLNIHGRFGRVVRQLDETRYYLQGIYEPGDTLEFRDASTVALLGSAMVVAVEKTPDGPKLAINDTHDAVSDFLVTLDKQLALQPLALVVFDGKRSADGFVIRNCWFHDNFQRTLINGAPNGLIENTTFQNVGHGLCVQFETWGPWMEGPFARNLVIRNNRFLGSPPGGPAISVSMHPAGGGTPGRRLDAKPVTNLKITGNYFGRTKEPALSIHNVYGLHIHDNRVDSSDWIALQDCENTFIKDNQLRK
ncbi:MAG: right-handed parallel beta-helix repeat-containing protein [Luteolibacter sp.]